MKSPRRFTYFLAVLGLGMGLIFLPACSASKKASTADNSANSRKVRKQSAPNQTGNALNPNEGSPSNLSLADMLRRVPGVTVSGSGLNVSVRVRGVSSINLSTEPLYVVDGVPVGSNYASIATTLNPNEIKRIKLLTGSDATIYGVRGGNGVIDITMKKD